MINIIFNNLYKMFSNKRRMIIICVLPTIFFGILMLVYSNTSINKKFVEPVRMGVVDGDDTIMSRMLISHFETNKNFTDFMEIEINEEEIIREKFANSEVDAMLIIPEEFSSKLMNMNHEPIMVKINTKDPVKAIVVGNILQSYENYISAVESGVSAVYDVMRENNYERDEILEYNFEISLDLVMTALERNDFFEYVEVVNIPNASTIHYFAISIITLLIMYFGLYVGLDFIKEKEQKTFQRLCTIGVSKTKFLISKVIAHTIFLLLIITLWLVGLKFIIDFSLSFELVLYLLSGIIFSVSFSLFLGVMFKKEDSMLLVGNIFYFISAVIGGSLIPLQLLPQNIQAVSKFTPNYWYIRGFLVMQNNIDSYVGVGVIVAFVVISVILWVFSIINLRHTD